jgi:hypothetical protein
VWTILRAGGYPVGLNRQKARGVLGLEERPAPRML